MGFFKWLFKTNQKEEHVRVPAEDIAGAALFEILYIKSHPCSCGGPWAVVDSGISFPTAYKACRCCQCGKEKRFVFQLRRDIQD